MLSCCYPAAFRYLQQKERANVQQWAKYDKEQKEITRQRELIQRLAGGAQSGRAAAAEKMLEKLQVHTTASVRNCNPCCDPTS